MRILVIGGTQFVGRHIVEASLASGDEVTIFHRGRTNPGLFPEAEHRHGDRNTDLSALATGEWDATVDTSAYVPRQVTQLGAALGGRGGRYVHISSVSAYAPPSGPGMTEDGPLAVLEDPTTETVTDQTYGGLKALCERASQEAFGGGGGSGGGESSGEAPAGARVSIVRPTYVVGPHDHSGRFTWWVQRAARGGRVLAPGPKDNPFQVIDVRDLAPFVMMLAHGEAGGTFHTVSPADSITFENFLDLVVDEVGPPGTELVWADPDVLLAAGLTGLDLPLWAAEDPDRDASAVDPSRAIAAGLRPRPLRQTIRELHAHELAHPTPVKEAIGLDSEREAQLLAASG
jgi:2'-hydroxyisoflavone reductase